MQISTTSKGEWGRQGEAGGGRGRQGIINDKDPKYSIDQQHLHILLCAVFSFPSKFTV